MDCVETLNKIIPEITLRDYFASQVLAGMGEYLMKDRDSLRSVAKSCYNVADAMIEVRDEKK